MRNLNGNLGYLLWFVVVFAGGFHLVAKGREIRPELEAKARLITALEKVIVATRIAAREGDLDLETLKASLLRHGIKARDLAAADGAGATIAQLAVRLSPDEEGRLDVRGNGARRIATARTVGGAQELELSALLLAGEDQ